MWLLSSACPWWEEIFYPLHSFLSFPPLVGGGLWADRREEVTSQVRKAKSKVIVGEGGRGRERRGFWLLFGHCWRLWGFNTNEGSVIILWIHCCAHPPFSTPRAQLRDTLEKANHTNFGVLWWPHLLWSHGVQAPQESWSGLGIPCGAREIEAPKKMRHSLRTKQVRASGRWEGSPVFRAGLEGPWEKEWAVTNRYKDVAINGDLGESGLKGICVGRPKGGSQMKKRDEREWKLHLKFPSHHPCLCSALSKAVLPPQFHPSSS